jgi:hypothetical protein
VAQAVPVSLRSPDARTQTFARVSVPQLRYFSSRDGGLLWAPSILESRRHDSPAGFSFLRCSAVVSVGWTTTALVAHKPQVANYIIVQTNIRAMGWWGVKWPGWTLAPRSIEQIHLRWFEEMGHEHYY